MNWPVIKGENIIHGLRGLFLTPQSEASYDNFKIVNFGWNLMTINCFKIKILKQAYAGLHIMFLTLYTIVYVSQFTAMLKTAVRWIILNNFWT